MKIIHLCIFVMALHSCVLSHWDTRLGLTNNTNKKIRYYDKRSAYNDFTLDSLECQGDLYSVLPHAREVLTHLGKWEFSLKNKVLRVYIINEDSLNKYGACEVFKKRIFMKRYDYTYNDLERIKWEIVYDGK